MTTMRAAGLTSAAGLLLAATATAHPYGWRVGQTLDGNLTIDFLWERSHLLDDQIPGFAGLADRGLAFEEFPVDNPPMNLFTLDPGGDIELVVVSFDDAIYLRDDKNLSVGIREPGESWSIGKTGTSFLSSPWWHLDTSDPDYTYQGLWSASFMLRDTSGIHGDSQTYTFLMRVPGPGGVSVIAAAGLLASRRRR